MSRLSRFIHFYTDEDDGNGGEKGVLKTVTGTIIHILDALKKPAKKLTVGMSPVQDLHGYDNPWPAGGGKNLFNGTFLQGYWAYADGAWSSDTKWITTQKIPCKPSTYYTTSADEKLTRWQGFVWYDSNGSYISTTNIQQGTNIGYTAQSPANAAYLIYDIAGYPASGSPISPSEVTHFQIEEGSTATTWTPFANECPITGHTGANVWDDPKYGGLINFNQIFQCIAGGGNGITVTTDSDKKIATIDGTATAVTYVKQTSIPKSISGHKYFATIGNNAPNGFQFYNDSGGVTVKQPNSSVIGTANSNNDWYFRSDANTTYNNATITPQLIDLTEMFGAGNEPSTVEEFKALFPNDYYAYNTGTETTVSEVNGDLYRHVEIEFPAAAGTVYGGTLTINEDGSGELVSKLKYFSFTSATLYGTYQSHPLYYVDIPNYDTDVICKIRHSKDNYVLISNILVKNTASSTGSMGDLEMRTEDNNTPSKFYFRYDEIAGISDLNTYLAENPLEVVAELQTPIEYTLTSQQVITLLAGENNIWADTNGTLELTYYADGNVSTLEALNTLLGGRYTNLGTPDDVSDKEALQIILGETT